MSLAELTIRAAIIAGCATLTTMTLAAVGVLAWVVCSKADGYDQEGQL